jgi:L-malate glycosyltransferase
LKTGRKQRILCVHTGGDALRGSEHALLEVLRRFKAAGRDVLLLCDRPAMLAAARSAGEQVRTIPSGELMFDWPDIKLNFLKVISANVAVRRHIQSFRPDIVYCNGGRSCQSSLVAARMTGLPIVVHLHAPYPRRYHMLYGTPLANAVIHCSGAIKRFHENRAHFRRSVLVLNGVDLDLMTLSNKDSSQPPGYPNLPDDRIVLGFIGSLIARKGLDILIDALVLLIQAGYPVFLLVAGHETSPIYREQVHKRKLEQHVGFIGEVTDRVRFFGSIDIHVLPSRSEAFGRTIIEAAACGVHSVAHRVDGIPEAMCDGRFGELYSPNDPPTLAQAIAAVIDKKAWQAKSAELATMAETKFGIGRVVGQLFEVFDTAS